MSVRAVSTPARTRPPRLRWSSDERLARRAADGDDAAFAALYERHHQALYRYCRSILRHDQDAQDALQATMLNALAGMGRLEPGVPVRAWLFRIAHNEAISLVRRRRVTLPLEESGEPPVASAESHLWERDRLAILVRDLQDLPERQRAALVMRELSGLGHEEIGVALSISTGAAKQAIYEARGALAEFAEGRAMACEDVRRAISDADGRVLRGRRVRAHLRDCGACAEFRASISSRRAELAALAPPLPLAASVGLLARLLGGGSGAGLAVKAATTPVVTKLMVSGLALVAAAGGTAHLTGVDRPSSPDRPATVAREAAAAAPAGARAGGAAVAIAARPQEQPQAQTRVQAQASPGPRRGRAGRSHGKARPGAHRPDRATPAAPKSSGRRGAGVRRRPRSAGAQSAPPRSAVAQARSRRRSQPATKRAAHGARPSSAAVTRGHAPAAAPAAPPVARPPAHPTR